MDSENFFDEDYYNEVYFDDEYIRQQIGCLPILLAVVGVALILVFALSQVEISIPATEVGAVNLNEAAGLGGNGIAPLFTPEVQYWSANIEKWSQQTGIDANLIATVMQIESCGDPRARSSAGAMGLFQVMPYHFENGEDPFKPATNALRGLEYLRRAREARGGVVYLGFAGYNGGITGAKRPESQWAKETQRYVYWGTGIYEDALQGKDQSDRLDEWLGRGGSSLCNQATQRLGLR
jgi:soluble lytic murein transglycosylase-like protein